MLLLFILAFGLLFSESFASTFPVFLISKETTEVNRDDPLLGQETEIQNLKEIQELSDKLLDAEFQKADLLFDQNQREQAKKIYKKLAKQGSVHAHYILANAYPLSVKEKLYHASEAAKNGHEGGLNIALKILFFNVADYDESGDNDGDPAKSSLYFADPQKALDLYNQAKLFNPSIDVSSIDVSKEDLNVLKMAAQAGAFDAPRFFKTYSISKLPQEEYAIWELAQDFSRGKFGKPDPRVLLQIISRSGGLRNEMLAAVEWAYNNWKKGIVEEFNPIEFVTTNIGVHHFFCKADSENDDWIAQKMKIIAKTLKSSDSFHLYDAYKKATNFIDDRVCHQNRGGGTRTKYIIGEQIAREKKAYIQQIERIIQKWTPKIRSKTMKDANQTMNRLYQTALKMLDSPSLREKLKEFHSSATCPSYEDIVHQQTQWIRYRDASINLFKILNPSVQKQVWNIWLTDERAQELETLLSAIKDFIRY